jgi:hypothetical protein
MPTSSIAAFLTDFAVNGRWPPEELPAPAGQALRRRPEVIVNT